ncbi:MAG TPA: ATP-binding protein, partial [Nautiliaceae bacterium]|nr:ATP-binding protein [Nautiliaceae bacterium]
MVKNIKLFLQNPKKSPIYNSLNVDENELKILKKLLEEYIDGNEDVKVRKLLKEIFNKKGLDAIEYVEYIKNLIDEGWVVISSFSYKNDDLTTLEILNSSISLSIAFLKLIEKGNLDLVIPENKPYNDHLEYLQDQFLRIELYEKLSNIKTKQTSKRIQSKIKLIENIIKEKIKKTKIELPVQNFIEENEFNEKEELLFLALLKEEYTSSNENARDQHYLLDLISNDEIERIKNRNLLDDNSKLINDGIFEYDELFNGIGGYSKIFFINEDILKELIHPKRKHQLEHIVKETIFDYIEPNKNLEDVVLTSKTKELIKRVLKQVDKKVLKLLKEWGVKSSEDINSKILFYGHPGTGKTLTAIAIANELNRPILSLDSSKVLSMYVGESEKNVRKIFDDYYYICEKLKTKPVLLLNEADQFLSTRTTSTFSSADKMHNQMQNIFLEQIEKFDGILIATTNLLETFDKAFSRRFDYKIFFDKPSIKERKKLWQMKLPKNAT